MLNLGMLQFGLGINTSGLTAAIGEVERFGRTVQGAQTAANRGFATNIQQLRRQENALIQGLERVRAMQERINNSTLAPAVKMTQINALNAAYDQLSKRITSAAAGLDPTKIDRATKSFTQATNEIGRGFQTIARSSRESEAAIERQTAAIFRARQAAADLSGSINRSAAPMLGLSGSAKRQQMDAQIEAATQQFQSRMSGGAVSSGQAKAWEREWREAINNVRREFANLGGQRAPDSIEAWRKGFHSLGAASLVLQGHLGGMSTRMFALSSIIRDNGVVFGSAAAGVIGFVGVLSTVTSAAIQSRLAIEKLTFALTAVEGSSAAAQGALQYVRQVSDQAGLAVDKVGASYMRLTAAGKAAGMSTTEVNNIFETFALASGTLALSAEDAQGVFRALDQIMSKGTVQAEELRGQLGDRLPGAFAIAADAMGKTTAELGKMMKSGEVISRDFLPKFTEQVKIAFGIDTSKQIETLQANMQRLSNSWLFFGQTVDQTFGITDTYIKLLKALSEALDGLAGSMDQVIGVAGALAGALAGLAVAMIAPTVLAAVGAGWAAISAAFFAASRGGLVLIGTLQGISAAMMAVPWAAVASAIVRIAVVLAGMKIGFDLAKGAAEGLNSSMQDLGPINQYIAQQKRLGFQVQATTAMYIKQAAVIAQSANLAAAQARANVGVVSSGVYIQDIAAAGAGATRGANPMETYKNAHQQRVNQAELAAQNAERAAAGAMKTFLNISNMIDMPTEQADPVSAMLGDDKKNKGKTAADRAREAVEDLINALQNAQAAMAMAFGGSPDFRAIDAIMEAKQLLQGMTSEDLAAFKDAMGMSGASAEELEAHIAAIIGKTNDARDSLQEFRSIWEEIQSSSREMATQKSVLAHLAGGGSDEGARALESLGEAQERLFQLSLMGDAGARAIAALQKELALLGYTGETTAEAFGKFLDTQKQIAEGVEAIKQVRDAWKEVGEELFNAQALLAAYGQSAAAGERMERVLDMAQKIKEFRENLEKANPGADVSAQVEGYARDLAMLDEVTRKLDETKQKMEELRQVWTDAWTTMYDNIIAVAEGTKSLGEALVDTIMSVLDQMAQNAINTLANESFGALFGKEPSGAAGVDQMSQSAIMASEALRQLAMSAGGLGMSMGTVANAGLAPLDAASDTVTASFQGLTPQLGGFGNMLLQILNGFAGGGGGGGIFSQIAGAVIKGGMSIFGGGGASIAPSAANIAANNFVGPRALGGPVTKGWAYQVNEQGAGQEVFIPGSDGYVGQSRGSTNQNFIDMSTTIDARGATQETIAELETRMLIREARLRSMLPHLIDARTRDNRQRLRN